MIDVYFIRHGETDHNAKHLHQPDNVPLNMLGKKQAEVTRSLIQKNNPTHFISSNFTRAAETAAILNDALMLPVEQNTLFHELDRPTLLDGTHHFHPRSVWYMIRWFFSKNEARWQKLEAESRTAFVRRVQEAQDYLETFPNNSRIVVVSHSVFINYFVARLCKKKPVSPFKAALMLLKVKTLDNSSLTHVSYDSSLPEGTCKWKLLSFDDDSHVVT